MKKIIYITLFLFAVLSLVQGKKKMQKIEKKRNKILPTVSILNETNYENFLKENTHVLLVFETVKCQGSKLLKPILKKLSIRVKEKNLDIKIARIDGILNPSIAEKYNVHKDNYPAIFLVNTKEHIVTEYHGEHSQSSLLSHINYRLQYNVKEITQLSQIKDLIKKRKHCLLFVGNKDDHQEQFNSVFRNYDELRPFLVLHTKNTHILEHFNIPSYSYDVVLFNVIKDEKQKSKDKKEKKEKSVKKDIKKEKNVKDKQVKPLNITLDDGVKMNLAQEKNLNQTVFLEYLHSYLRPLVAPLNNENLNAVFQEGITTLFLIGNDAKQLNSLALRVAPRYRPHIWFLVAKYSDEENRLFMKNMKIKKDNLPALVLFNHHTNNVDDLFKYKWTSENKKIEEQDIENFISGWKTNKLKRYLISEDIPKKSQSKGGIFRIVGENLPKFLSNVHDDLIILFCTHFNKKCSRLEGVYDLLSMKLKNNTNITVAELDPTSNEFDALQIKEVPHLMLFKGGQDPENRLNSPISYSGNYTLKDLVEFVEKNANDKVEVAHLGKKENKFLKYEAAHPVLIEGEEDYNLSYYSKYGKQRFLGDYESDHEGNEEINYDGMDDDDHSGHLNEMEEHEEHPEEHHEEDHDDYDNKYYKEKSKKYKKGEQKRDL